MAAFWAIAVNEARQLWRRRSFWVIQALLLLPVALIAFGPPVPSALVLLYLVIPILVGPALLRDAGKSGEIVWSSPTGALTHYAGLIAGLWLGLLPGSLLQLAGWFLASLFIPGSFSASLYVPASFSFWIWPLSLAFLLLANTVGLFLAALLAMLVRRQAPLLIVWTALWLWVFQDVSLSPGIAESFVPMQATAFHNIFFHNLKLSPSLGLGLSRDRVFGMSAWFLGLGLLAAGLGLAASLLADRRRSLRRPLLLPVLILVGALSAAGGYALNARAAAAHAVPASPMDPQINVWGVDSQRTEVEVDAAAGLVSGTSRLVLSAARPLDRPELVLRLNPGLDLAYARDGSGADLPARRVGDSLVLSLPAIPAGPLQLDLAWQGRLQVSYLSFEQDWKFPDGPGLVPYWYTPAPLEALLIPQGGFLLRDGDWMPWPWSSTPHQAGRNSLTIRPLGGQAAAARPLEDGAATWDGIIPEGLVAFLPSKQVSSDGAVLAVSPLAGSQHTARARLFAAAAAELAPRLGEAPPRCVVVAPYLSELVWSGDLLLIPDGSGFYLSDQLAWLFMNDVEGPGRPLLERSAYYLLAREWIHSRYPAPPLLVVPRLSPPGSEQVVSIAGISPERWYRERGHWVQFPEAQDMTTTWSPRRSFHLNPPGEQSALAFWLAMELAGEETRRADLDLLAYFAGVDQQLQGHGERYDRIHDLFWPFMMYAAEARELVWDLHQWAARVGPEEALGMAVEVIQASDGWDRDQVLAGLEARSGVPIGEGR